MITNENYDPWGYSDWADSGFMTSANVIHFVVTEIESGKTVGRYRQNQLCKDHVTGELAKHQPPYLFHLLVKPDENEADETLYSGSLEDWLDRK